MSSDAANGQSAPLPVESEQVQSAQSRSADQQTLADVGRGQRVTITAVDATSPEVQRLMTLGLVEGAEIELAGKAIGGDPLEFRLFGRGVSLRKEQARCFAFTTARASD